MFMKMKQSISILSGFALLCLTACQEEDFGVQSKAVEFKSKFEETFGAIPEGQDWDFYKQSVQSLAEEGTRATTTTDDYVLNDNYQGTPLTDKEAENMLADIPDGVDNRNKGTHNFSFTAKANSLYIFNAICYAGWYEAYAKYDFDFGIYYKTADTNYKKLSLLGGLGITTAEKSNSNPTFNETEWYVNPSIEHKNLPGNKVNLVSLEFLKDVDFYFYISYTNGSKQERTSLDGNAALLYEDINSDGSGTMLLCFEDKPKDDWDSYWEPKPDFNDVVFYVTASPLPVLASKRFFCEDLGNIHDFDYNDIVFDVHQVNTNSSNNAEVYLRAVGGTLPIWLYVDGKLVGSGSDKTYTDIEMGGSECTTTTELHNLLGLNDTCTPINVIPKSMGGTIKEAFVYTMTIDDFAGKSGSTSYSDVKAFVKYSDTETGKIFFTNKTTDTAGTPENMYYYGSGSLPYIIAVPVSTLWTREEKRIGGTNGAYPSFFKTNWYTDTPTEGSVMKNSDL